MRGAGNLEKRPTRRIDPGLAAFRWCGDGVLIKAMTENSWHDEPSVAGLTCNYLDIETGLGEHCHSVFASSDAAFWPVSDAAAGFEGFLE